MIVKAREKTIHRKMVNYIFLKCKFLLLFAFLCLFFVNRTNATSQSFGFSDTGQQLGQIADDVASIACGDMNNDGYVDLILASQESGTIIQLYLNDGKGNFEKTEDAFPVTDDSNPLWNFGIVLHDFNRDAQLDIATADAWRGVNIYLKNTKNGSFEWAQAILVPDVNEVKGIDAADVDNDGDDDIVFGGHNGIPDRGDRVYLNDGLGYFVDSGQQIGSDVTWDTIFGDIDNDGDFDYISINRYGEHTSKIHLNNGSGVFDDTIDIPTTQTDDSHDVKLADLNTDGLLDIVIANSVNVNGENGTTTSKIFINKSNHIFELAEDTLGEPNCETKGIEVVDVTNDGYYDIVLGNYNIANMIYQNDGTGKFEKMDIEIPTNQATAIAAVDVNNDGFIDLVIGNAPDSHYKVYLNDGNGLPKNLRPEPPTILKSNVNGENIYLSWEFGFDPSGFAIQFSDSNESIGCWNTARLIAADLNGDETLDIILGNGEELEQANEVYLNDGRGHFTHSNQTFDTYFLRDMTVGDIDEDDDLDLIVCTQGDGVKVLKNDGGGLFQVWQNLGSQDIYVRAGDLGDVDGDGDLDLLYGSVGNRIYLNNGNGSFIDSGQDLKDHYLTQAVKFADIDGDGDLDFVQGNRKFEDYDSSDRIFFNNGNGVFTDSGQRLGQWATLDIDLGDVDEDDDLDLITVSQQKGVNKLYLNDGKGNFTDSNQILDSNPDNNESKAVQFGDIDNDGDLELVIGDWNLGLKIFLNDNYGHFTEYGVSLGSGKVGDVVLADIDHDGDLDIVESNKEGNCNKIYLNNQASTPLLSLTYNIRIGSSPEGNDIVSGASPYRMGHLGNTLSYAIKGIKEGTYSWSVQTVDSSFKKSEWSQAEQFEISESYTECNPASITASTSKLIIKVNQSGEVTVTVKGEDGCLSEGVNVNAKISKSGKEKVSVSPESTTTDGNGEAIFTFTGIKKGKAKAIFNAEGVEGLDEKVKILIMIK